MTTIRGYLKNAKFVRDNILNETERIVYRNEAKITQMQAEQVENGIGNDGLPLKSNNRNFTGFYSPKTANLAMFSPQKPLLPKIIGQPYNFVNTGVFISNFMFEITDDLTGLKWRNTGTGSGSKAEFFRSYEGSYLGLSPENSEFVKGKIVFPEVLDFVNRYL